MSNLNKFFPAGSTTKRTFQLKKIMNTNSPQKKMPVPGYDMNNEDEVMECWKKLGSPSCTVIMCGYKISSGKLVS